MSIKQTTTIDEVITLLNELIELDKPAIAALLANRVPCNEALADHPTVQVATQNDGWHVGCLASSTGYSVSMIRVGVQFAMSLKMAI